MATGSGHALRGQWYFDQSRPGCVRAFGLSDESEVVFEGALAEHPELAARAAGLPELERALSAPEEPATLRRLLAPEGFGLLFLELTGRCNENCVHCYASSGPEVSASLDRELIFTVLRDAAALGFRSVQLTGGDPLVSPHFLQAAELCRELGLEIEVYTNGLALREELVRSLVPLEADLAFSVYSSDPAAHDAVTRTPGSHARTLAAIALAQKYGLEVRVGVVLSEVNAATFDETVSLLIAQGIDESKIATTRERGVGRGEHRNQDERLERGRAHASEPDRLGKLCVSYEGKVLPCIFDRKTVLGDVRKQSLDAILDQEIGALRFPRHLRPVSEELSCQDCQFRRRLLGG